jgi:hypothetical protein
MKVKKVRQRKVTRQKLATQLDYYSYVTKMWRGAAGKLGKSLSRLDEALDATQLVRVEVTGKGGVSLGKGGRRVFEFVEVPDHRTRLSAANTVFRIIKEVAEKRAPEDNDTEAQLGKAMFSFIKAAQGVTTAVPAGAEPEGTDED